MKPIPRAGEEHMKWIFPKINLTLRRMFFDLDARHFGGNFARNLKMGGDKGAAKIFFVLINDPTMPPGGYQNFQTRNYLFLNLFAWVKTMKELRLRLPVTVDGITVESLIQFVELSLKHEMLHMWMFLRRIPVRDFRKYSRVINNNSLRPGYTTTVKPSKNFKVCLGHLWEVLTGLDPTTNKPHYNETAKLLIPNIRVVTLINL